LMEHDEWTRNVMIRARSLADPGEVNLIDIHCLTNQKRWEGS
jgi:hypothetical protein